jgi:hypothetical protein
MLINEYKPGVPFKNFPDLATSLAKHYDRIYDTALDFEITPRYIYESGIKIGFRDIFYYIDCLYTHGPTSVIDVGCGECIWKKYFPNIIGFDPNTNEFSTQDFVDYFDRDFSQNHAQQYDCGMALNSMHFINWNDVPKQIDLAMNIVKDRFLFTFNFSMISNKPNVPMTQLIALFDEFINASNYNIILLDYPVLRGITQEKVNKWSYINGTVRFILEHRHSKEGN